MNIFLLTDKTELQESCSKYIYAYAKAVNIQAEIIIAEDTSQLEQMAEKHCPDIVYLDMSSQPQQIAGWVEGNAFSYPGCSFAVISDNEQYAVWGYRNRISDYIVLPATQQQMNTSLENIIKTNYSDLVCNISIKIRGVWQKLDIDRVVYMETSNHRINFYLENGEMISEKGSFNMISHIINCNPFLFQCHKSYVVNGKHIADMTQTAFKMSTGDSISISRPYRVKSRVFFSEMKINGNKKTYPLINNEEICEE